MTDIRNTLMEAKIDRKTLFVTGLLTGACIGVWVCFYLYLTHGEKAAAESNRLRQQLNTTSYDYNIAEHDIDILKAACGPRCTFLVLKSDHLKPQKN